jgi:membrane-associated phospholipid phosphatase
MVLAPVLIVFVDPISIHAFRALARWDDGMGQDLFGFATGPLQLLAQCVTRLLMAGPVVALAALLWGYSLCGTHARLRRFVGAVLMAGLLQVALGETLKRIAGRERPDGLFTPDGAWHDVWHPFHYGGAFPGGHATFAFLLAAIGSAYWPECRGWWYALAVAIALSRCVLLQHNLSDTVVGAGLGWYIGAFFTGAYPVPPEKDLDHVSEARAKRPSSSVTA